MAAQNGTVACDGSKNVWTGRGESGTVVREEGLLMECGDDGTLLYVGFTMAERRARLFAGVR